MNNNYYKILQFQNGKGKNTMTDIIKFNEEHTPKTEIGKMKFELAEALTAISDLQNPYRLTELSKEQRYKLYNKSMREVCEILDIDLDMHEMMKTGAEGFSYSDTEDNTKPLENLLSDKQSYDIKTKLFNLFTLASGLSHSDTDFITVDDKGVETPATQQELAKALRTNLVELTESLGLSVDQVTESHTEQTQEIGENKMNNEITEHLNKAKKLLIEKYSTGIDVEANNEALNNIKRDFDFLEIYAGGNNEGEKLKKTVKNTIEVLEEVALYPHKDSTSDVDVLGDIVYSFVTDLKDILGFEESSESHTETSKNTIKEQLQDIYSLNDSMITGDPYHIPTYDDGTVIKQSDLADMNMNALDLIAEMLGLELEEGAVQLVQPQADKPVSEMTDQEVYESLPAEDKLNVDMLNKLHEVQDHILKSGQDAVSMNQVQTAISILEGSLGVMGKVEE